MVTRSSISINDLNPNLDLNRDIYNEIQKKAIEVSDAYREPECLLISIDLYMLLLQQLREKSLLKDFDIDTIDVGGFEVKVFLLNASILDFFDISYKSSLRKTDILDKHPKTKREEIPDSEVDTEEFLKNINKETNEKNEN